MDIYLKYLFPNFFCKLSVSVNGAITETKIKSYDKVFLAIYLITKVLFFYIFNIKFVFIIFFF